MSLQTTPADNTSGKILLLLPVKPINAFTERVAEKWPHFQVEWISTRLPDGGKLNLEDLPQETWEGVRILATFDLPRHPIPGLRYVQLASSGSNQCEGNILFADPNILFCTANGVHPPQIAEWVIGTWITHQHHFRRFAKQMEDGFWEPVYQTKIEDSVGCRMGIMGYGAIGRQCANVGRALGMDVVAYTRRERKTPESRQEAGYSVAGLGDADGLVPSAWYHGSEEADVNNFLSQDLDLLILSLPLTPATRGLIKKKQFEILAKKKTFLVNIGRGPLVNTNDLIDALENGTIRGAALDVTDPEPLPQDHPLWKAPNLFITPHVSWVSNHYYDRILEILEINLDRLHSDQPLLNNVER